MCFSSIISINSACQSSHQQREEFNVATYHSPSMYCYSNCVVASQHKGLNVESYTCEKPDPYGRKIVCNVLLLHVMTFNNFHFPLFACK